MSHARRTLHLLTSAGLTAALTAAIAASPATLAPPPDQLRLAAGSPGPVTLSTTPAPGTVPMTYQGFDIKWEQQANKLADPVTGADFATQAFGNGPRTGRSNFNLLRIPIYADNGGGDDTEDHVQRKPDGQLHPDWSTPMYQHMLAAIRAVNVVKARQDETIRLFASLRSVDTGVSGGTFDPEFGQKVDPVEYGEFLRNYAQELKTRLEDPAYNHVVLMAIGPDNEPRKYSDELDLSKLPNANALMNELDGAPSLEGVDIVENDGAVPEVDTLRAYRGNQVWNKFEIAGTHFQGPRHSNAAILANLKSFADIARGTGGEQNGVSRDLPAWDTEYHFFKDELGKPPEDIPATLGNVADGVRGLFDHLDFGYSG
ncbi:MAG: hypothetical protein JWO76_3193, partial [Nocardioides sp.]|nr:hypothetical protein [Nocardioides sp.]